MWLNCKVNVVENDMIKYMIGDLGVYISLSGEWKI